MVVFVCICFGIVVCLCIDLVIVVFCRCLIIVLVRRKFGGLAILFGLFTWLFVWI